MRKIIFKKIYIKNFLSIGNSGLSLDYKNGVNLVLGINKDKNNSNGTGKSAVFSDALFWVLFGKTQRNLKNEDIVNNINKKNCEVKVEFDVACNGEVISYEVARSLKPGKIILKKNGVDITQSSMPKTTNLIHSIIGTTQEVFENSIAMSINNSIPFLAQNKTDKRKFIEGILGLNVFSDILLEARNESNKEQRDFQEQYEVYKQKEKHLVILENNLNTQEEIKNKRIDNIKSRIKEDLDNIKNLEDHDTKALFDLKEYKEKYDKAKNTLKSLKENIKSIQVDKIKNEALLKQIRKNLKDFEGCKGSICPKCSQSIDNEHFEKHKEEFLKEIEEKEQSLETLSKDLDQFNSQSKKIKTFVDLVDSKIEENKKIEAENKNIENKIHILKSNIQRYKEDFEEVKKEKNTLTEDIKNIEIEIEQDKVQIENHKKMLDIYENVKFIVSEEGVKSFIINKLLNVLNSRLDYYLKKMDAPCICVFNEMFEEKFNNDMGIECSYFNFSSGERRRIDLAMLFMFQDLRRLQSNVHINISIFDEIFDSSIDEPGIAMVNDILRERQMENNESIFIITHNKDTIRDTYDNTFVLEKNNGFTCLN